MYHDFLGREIEDLEWDNMRRDAYEDAKERLTMQKEYDLASILITDVDAVAQATENGLVYTVRETYDPHTGAVWTTLYVADGAMPPFQTTDYEEIDDITEAYPGLKWSVVEMEV